MLRILFFSILVTVSLNSKGEVFSVNGSSLMYKGYVINSDFNINESNFRAEGGVLARAFDNSLNEYETIRIISELGALEVWVFSEQIEGKLIKVASFSREVDVEWLSGVVLKFSRSRMGSSTDYLTRLDLSNMTFKLTDPIKNMIYFDTDTNNIVRYAFPDKTSKNDRLIVFNLISKKEQIFNIDLNYDYRSEALGLFKDIIILNGNLNIEIKEINGETVLFSFPLSE